MIGIIVPGIHTFVRTLLPVYERNLRVRGLLRCILAIEVHTVDRCSGFVCVLVLHLLLVNIK
jgi:hypothetical protein